MIHRNLLAMFLLLAVSSCRIVAAQVEQAGDKTINVKAFGAKGDGVADDTRAIQAAINHAKAGEKIYFPPGIYDVSNFVVKNRSGLSFTGDGRQSMIRQKSGAARMATIEASSDIAITNLAFDANGIVSYGGVVFYAVKGVRIENNIFIDRAAKPIGSTDRYSFVFGRGSVPSQDVKILNNMIEDLQLEVDHAQRVLIDRNTVKRAIATAGIGIFTVGDKAIAEDYQITNNTILDPPGAGLSVGLDPPTDSHCIFRRITMAGNQIVRTKTAGYGIRIGTPNNSIKTTGNVFEDIEIKNNRILLESGAPPIGAAVGGHRRPGSSRGRRSRRCGRPAPGAGTGPRRRAGPRRRRSPFPAPRRSGSRTTAGGRRWPGGRRGRTPAPRSAGRWPGVGPDRRRRREVGHAQLGQGADERGLVEDGLVPDADAGGEVGGDERLVDGGEPRRLGVPAQEGLGVAQEGVGQAGVGHPVEPVGRPEVEQVDHRHQPGPLAAGEGPVPGVQSKVRGPSGCTAAS